MNEEKVRTTICISKQLYDEIMLYAYKSKLYKFNSAIISLLEGNSKLVDKENK